MSHSAAKVSTLLRHPNIVKAFDCGVQDGEDPVLLMERVEGVSLADALRLAAGRRLPLSVALYIASEVLTALAYAHELRGPRGEHLEVVHCDVYPGNILLGLDGRVKLTEFGVARSRGVPPEARSDARSGSFGYLSPEQISGHDVDRRSDLFSVGAILFEMLTGSPLFGGNSDHEVLSRVAKADIAPLADPRITGLPLELRLILAGAVARDANERFQRAAEFSDALSAFAGHVRVSVERSALSAWLPLLEIAPARSGRFQEVPSVHAGGTTTRLR